MELTVIGKYGPYATDKNMATSCYLVRDNGASLVMDMGAGTLGRLLSVIDIKDIDAIYLSHLHYDHTSDLLTFRYLLEDLKRPITIYTHLNESEWCKILLTHPLFNVIDIDENSVVNIGGMRLSFYLMNHTVPDYGVKIKGKDKTLSYTGDTRYTDKLYDLIDGADCLLADCSKPAGFQGPHMTADKTIEIYEKTGVRILATHLNPDYNPKDVFAPYKGIAVVEELTTYHI